MSTKNLNPEVTSRPAVTRPILIRHFASFWQPPYGFGDSGQDI